MAPRVLVLAALALAPAAFAQEEFRHGRIRHVEPGVTIQGASETGAAEAERNLPFLPGDRVWTDEGGRVEFQFASGSTLRLDVRSKLDYVAHEDRGREERVVLRLWSGGSYLYTGNNRGFPDFDIETPGGLIEVRQQGVVRLDVVSGEVRVSVYEGEATLDTGRRRVKLDAGERTYARSGDSPERPERFNRSESDEFARWDAERAGPESWASDSLRHLPPEMAPYARDFDDYGSWYHESDIGYVWRPAVAPGWRPYWNGRWCWTSYGWTWVPHEPWGWAPFHYGRWGHSIGLGWYWIPDRTWGPAWVSWSIGRDYVGWSPLGHRNRAIVLRGRRDLGHAVPRGSAPRGRPAPRGGTAEGAETVAADETSPWVYARRADMGARDLARRRVQVSEAEARELRVVESPRARIGRDLRVHEGETAAPRAVKTRPTPGDTIPELRSDPTTTIPFPVARRRYPSEDERKVGQEGKEGDGTQRRVRPRFERGPAGGAGATAAAPSHDSPPPQDRAVPQDRHLPPGSHPTDVRSPGRERRAAPDSAERQRESESAEDQDRAVLRRLFRPLGESRGSDRDAGEGWRQGAGEDSGARRSRPAPEPRGWSRDRDSGQRPSGEDAGARSRPRPQPREASPPRVEQRQPPQPRPDGERGERAVRKRERER
jgi:hypothetical protein